MRPALFHPAVDGWFCKTFSATTQAQARACPRSRPAAMSWSPRRRDGEDLGRLPRRDRRAGAPWRKGDLPDKTCVVYVSPLKALSNDIQRNLEAPLAGIRAELAAHFELTAAQNAGAANGRRPGLAGRFVSRSTRR